MRSTRTLRRLVTSALCAAAFLLQGTWALAGVTGGIAGIVHDDTGAPVAGATVKAASPSQTATATTDAQGHFTFLTLAPDTYTITVTKDGYQTVAQSGLTVLADQTQTITIVTPRVLKVIATAKTSASALVKPGVGGDLYNVTPATQQASASLGGGGNLENAYSAISSVPGLYVPTGGMGWNQMVVIHGEYPWSTGFEYDGVPVNRAFDQYNSSTESSLGLQELQVYTGGGPVSVASSGISGFINQVIKTGTYPGYASLQGGVGTEAFYHEAKFEAGGATPDRNFSYYVGLAGTNQAFRIIDQSNGASYFQPGGVFAPDSYNNIFQFTASADYGYGDTAACVNKVGNLGYLNAFLGHGGLAALLPGFSTNTASYNNSCLMYDAVIGNSASFITDREDVVNLHFGIPRHDGQRDDIQVLWSASSEKTFGYNSPSDQLGACQMALTSSGMPCSYNPNFNAWYNQLAVDFGIPQPTGVSVLCQPYCENYPYYNDAEFYNLPFGTAVNNSAGTAPLPYENYYYPSTPQHSFAGQLPLNTEDNMYNDVGIMKLQWTHPFSDSAYVRLYSYILYTDWNMVAPNSSYEYFAGPFVPFANDYLLTTHTAGGAIQFADQINDQNLVQLTANYVTANTSRWYNTAMVDGAFSSPALCGASFQACANSSPIGLVAYSGGTFSCYAIGSGKNATCVKVRDPADLPAGWSNGGSGDSAYNNFTSGEPPIAGAALAAGAKYITTVNTDARASDNNVGPRFYNINLSEEFRPSDRLVIDLAGRYDNYNYVMQSTQNIQNQYYAQIIDDYACVNPATDTPALTPLGPGSPPPPGLAFYWTCPAGYVHPNGVGGHPHFTDVSPSHYDINYWSARGAATYQSDPNTVWRVSAGRYVEPPLTAAVQYFNSSGNNLGQWGEFMLFGFMSPFHPLPAETSSQYDFSFEHHFAGTDVSLKITPFYHYASNWQQQYFIGSGYVTQIPVGDFRSYGVEAELQAGDFNRNGLSGLLSFTYTNAAVQYKSLLGESIVNQLNTAIEAYDCQTKTYYASHSTFCNTQFGVNGWPGAASCYQDLSGPSPGAADPGCPNSYDVANPYYNATPQPLMDPNGWWSDPGQTSSGLYLGPGYNDAAGFVAPYTATLILNWRMDKLAITPSLQFASGSSYGSPMDVLGIDPWACASSGLNQNDTGVVLGSHNCDYTSYGGGSMSTWGQLYVPNPQTGTFAQYGAFRQPNIIVGNIQATYDVSPKLRLTLTAASVFHTCFGGSSEPWTQGSNAPGHIVCGYGANALDYIGGPPGGGAYVGASPTDPANGITPQPWEMQSYLPSAFTGGSANGYFPFNLYIQAQLHL